MVISKYLDSIEGTEDEQKFKEAIAKLSETEEITVLLDKPGIGPFFKSIFAIAEADSIADFKQSEHYANIKDWSITVFDLENGTFSIHPGPKHVKMFLAVAAMVGVGIYLFKRRRRSMQCR